MRIEEDRAEWQTLIKWKNEKGSSICQLHFLPSDYVKST